MQNELKEVTTRKGVFGMVEYDESAKCPVSAKYDGSGVTSYFGTVIDARELLRDLTALFAALDGGCTHKVRVVATDGKPGHCPVCNPTEDDAMMEREFKAHVSSEIHSAYISESPLEGIIRNMGEAFRDDENKAMCVKYALDRYARELPLLVKIRNLFRV